MDGTTPSVAAVVVRLTKRQFEVAAENLKALLEATRCSEAGTAPPGGPAPG